MAKKQFIEANRIFTPIRQWGWILTLLIAIGGLWFPKLGLIVPFIILAEIGMSLFLGKYWCGNFCPHGSLFDKIILPYSKNNKIPPFLRTKTAIFVMFGIFLVGMSNRLANAFIYIGTAEIWDQLGFVFVVTYLVVTIVGTIVGLVTTPRTWCVVCPMGTMQHGLYKLGKQLGTVNFADKKIVMDTDKCKKCNKCSKVCPVQLEPYPKLQDEVVLEDEECIKCSTCVNHCPVKALSLSHEQVYKK